MGELKSLSSFVWCGQRSQKYSKQIKWGLVDHSNFEDMYLNKERKERKKYSVPVLEAECSIFYLEQLLQLNSYILCFKI